MKVVLLAGGLGTRLREETEYRPKPMVEVGGKPILWHIMKNFAHFGYREFIICIGYKGEVVRDYFLDFAGHTSDFTIRLGERTKVTYHGSTDEADWEVTVVDTGARTMTGGRVKRIEPFTSGERFMVTYGDGLADIDIKKLVAFHLAHGQLATVTTVRPVSRFGVLDIGPDGRVGRFEEKPQLSGHINAGFFVFEPGVFSYLDEECVLEQEPLRNLARDRQLFGYQHEGFWQPMDTYREFTALNEMWDSGAAPWRTW